MRQIEEYLAKREKVFLVLSSFVVQCMMKAKYSGKIKSCLYAFTIDH